MAAAFFHYILLLLVVLLNAVRSQNNTNSTNSTSLTTTISPNTTVYFTSSPTLTTICIEDREYDEQYTRITGEYEQLIDSDDNGHPVWQQDKRYNIDENVDWRIYFDMNTYMNWVIGEGTSYPPVAYCNDTITADPTDCNIWYEKPINSFLYQISTELLLEGDLCPAPDPNANGTHFCVLSRSPELTAYTGTYVQQIDGVAEWFYTSTDGVVSYLHWTLFRFMSSSGLLERYGWSINVGTVTKALCVYSELDVSINNSYIQFVPTLCAEWVVGDVVDHTFDIDANVCGIDRDSNVSMLCVASYTIAIDDVYSVWSGVYVMNVTDGYVYNHRLWRFTVGDDMYSILYSQVADAWIVSKADIVYARCADNNNNQQNLYYNPTQCSDWNVVDSTSGILLTAIESGNECVVTITTSTETTDSGEATGSKSKTLLADFSVSEFVAIGAALLVFPICIICFVCYQKRKAKKHTHDEGISLQPYVPTGMAYDSYKQNKIHQAQVAKQAKRKKEERDHKRRSRTKLKAPTSVASASVDVGEDQDMAGDNAESTVDSTQALINVFDEDDAMQPDVDDMAGTDTENPFLRDGIIRTGQTIDETHNELRTSDILHAFDE